MKFFSFYIFSKESDSETNVLSQKNPWKINNCYVRVQVTVQKLSDTVNKYSTNGKEDAHPHETK